LRISDYLNRVYNKKIIYLTDFKEKITYKISENLLNHVVDFYSLILPGAGKNPTFIQIRGEIFCPGVIFYFGKETENET